MQFYCSNVRAIIVGQGRGRRSFGLAVILISAILGNATALLAARPISVKVDPSGATLGPGQTWQFAATVNNASNRAVAWSLTPTVGSISSTGFYTAPAVIGFNQTITVKATSLEDVTKSGTATVSLQAPISVIVTPGSVSLAPGESQAFTASVANTTNNRVSWSITPPTGTISNKGVYIAPAQISSPQTVTVTATSTADSTKSASAIVTLNPPTVAVAVSVAPGAASLSASQAQQFAATVSGTSNTAVAWSLNPAVGSISSTGLYTAPAAISSQQTVTVTATSAADAGKSASAVVTLNPPGGSVAVTVAPGAASLSASQTQQFAATVSGTANTAVVWSLSPAMGSISSAGLYTAPAAISTQQNVIVTATSAADSTKSASAVVTLTPPAVAVSVSVAPTTASLSASQAQQFAAMITGTTNTAVIWSLNPAIGTITTSGLYTAPAAISSQQTVTVTATSAADTSRSASAPVTLIPPVVSVSVSPASVSLAPSQTQQFGASVSGTSNTAVTWSLNPSVGTISSTGLYTAPAAVSSQQTITITATSAADQTKSASSTVTVTPAASVEISPSTASLLASQSQQFTAAVGGSYSSVTWALSAPKGTLSSSGTTAIYNAPSTLTQNDSVQLTATAKMADGSTITRAALITLVASTATTQTFTLKEEFGVSHPRQIVEFRANAPFDPAQHYMLGPDGNEVPFQLLNSGSVAVDTDLPAGTTRTWKLQSGRPPAAFTDTVKLTEQPAYYEVTNGLTGVRVFRGESNTRTVPIATVSVSNGVATITTAVDHYLETVVADAQMPTAKLAVTLSGITGACSYLNGKVSQILDGKGAMDPSARVVKMTSISGADCSSSGGTISLPETSLAPIQGILLRDGTWTNKGNERLRIRDDDAYFAFEGRVLNARQVSTRLVESGPLKTVVEVTYAYNRRAKTFAAERSCVMLGFATTPCTIPAGDGYYRSIITVQAGQPSILIEDDTDMDLKYQVDVHNEIQPTQGRYRGHHANQISWGYEADGRQYRPINQRPGMDAFRDLSHDLPLRSSFDTWDEAGARYLSRITAWNPWAANTGWYWTLYNKSAGSSAPVIGAFAAKASRAMGVVVTGPGVYVSPASSGTPTSAGFWFESQRRGPDNRAARSSRMQWGIFVGTKANDLADPSVVQNVNRQMNIHGGFNLTKLATYDTAYREPSGGFNPLYMSKDAVNRMINRLRTDTAYYSYLCNAEPSIRDVINAWRDTSGAAAQTLASAITSYAHNLLNALINQNGIYEFEYHYWQGGVEMSRRALMINSLLVSDLLPLEQRQRLYAVAVLFAEVLWDDDFVPMLDQQGISMGTENMPVQHSQYRQLFALMFADHPMMAQRKGDVQNIASSTINSQINTYGAQAGAVGYANAAMVPLINTLQQLKVNVGTDLFATQERLRKFAEFYLNFLTPREPRFGNVRKTVSLGDSATESFAIFGQMATAFAGVDSTLSGRLMGAWVESGKRHIDWPGSSLLKIDESLPAASPNLGSATFPGWHSVLRNGFGSNTESALWFINGDDYRDHRHFDHGSVAMYSLSSPLSVDWGSVYYPAALGAYMHSMVLPETSIGAKWDADNLPPDTGKSPWAATGQELFAAFNNSSAAQAGFTTLNGTRWTRSVRSIHANPLYPVILISDQFAGPDALAGKVFTLNLMAQGAISTPVGSVTPPLRLYDYAGTRQEMPSAGSPFTLASGLNRFQFTGQWNINWDLYNVSTESQQAVIGSWGHTWHPLVEQNQFQQANGRKFEESQYILRLRGTTQPFRVLLLPYLKGGQRSDQTVSRTGSDTVIRAGGEETIIGDQYYAFQNTTKAVVTTFGSASATAHGIQISGGPAEIVLTNGTASITVHGTPGERRFTIQGFSTPVAPVSYSAGTFVLPYDGGGPLTVVLKQ